MDNRTYRKIWEKHYGPIPKDINGRSYEIHHINGNHSDNRIENLKLVTIQEHYNIHKQQGDWVACHLIAQRMNISPEEKSRLISESNKKRVGSLNPFFGKHHTDKTKAVIAKKTKEFHTGRKRSQETRNKMSLALKGIKKSKEHCKAMSIAKMGKICKSFTWKVEYKGKEIIVKNLKQFCKDKKIQPFSSFNYGKEINGFKKIGRVA